jgi:methionine sulfoxide reductase catalytic subunit
MNKNDRFESVPVSREEITPETLYRTRRHFLKTMGLAGAALVLAACSPLQNEADTISPDLNVEAGGDELGDQLNTYEEITNYNNFYEFTTDKQRVAPMSKDFRTSPWEVEVYGLVKNPRTFSMEEILSTFEQEERVYRLRCVEGWSMVIPWNGFPLARLLEIVEPTAEAQFVRFETIYDPEQMPGQKSRFYDWPYQEGLRLDEAMHDLTILATGLYGRAAAPGWRAYPPGGALEVRLQEHQVDRQDRAGYGYAFHPVVRLRRMNTAFTANVNPEVAHPRWSQASERRIGESGRRKTLMFNGYAGEVAHLYEGMDLRINY